MELNHQEKEPQMQGLSFAQGFIQKIVDIAHQMEGDVMEIPDTGRQVLVRDGTPAFAERMKDQKILKLPIRLKSLVAGTEVEQDFFVCSR